MHPLHSLPATAIVIALSASPLAHAQDDADKPATQPAPVIFTTQQDHQNMLEQLGITKLRPGRSPNADSPNVANSDEAQANPYPDLPPLLTTAAGDAVTTPEQWRDVRRPELVKLIESDVYGRIPDNVPSVKWEVTQTRDVDSGGKPAVQHQLVGIVDNAKCPEIEVRISLSLTLPKDVSGPVPVLMTFGPTPFEMERFRGFGGGPPGGGPPGGGPRPPSKQDKLIAAGWGCAMLNPSSVQDDSGGWQPRRFGPNANANANAEPAGAGLTRGIIGLTNLGQPRQPDQWGALRAWAWGASRALDYLETVPEVDAKKVGIAGVSRYGKAALVTLAFDERFAAGLIASSGAGGTKLYRRNFGEALENLAGSGGYHWMAGNYLKYSAAESSFGSRTAADLPVDSHMTLALCAPRLTFISHGIPEKGDAHWLDHRGSWMAAIASQPAYRLLGASDLGRSDDYLSEAMPAVNEDVLDGVLAWRQHDGGHTDEPNVEHFIRWADAKWQRTSAPATAASAPDAPPADPARPASLKAAAGDHFKIGVGISHVALQNPDDAALVCEHFQILTPENCMKPPVIQPAEGQWNFADADAFVDFARTNKLDVVGHCLLWAKDENTADWMLTDNGRPVSRDTLLKRIDTHISTVVSRYADAVTMWDVVNEAAPDSGGELVRDSIYSRTTGIDFLVAAFKAARAADPDALLIYNDYNDQKPGKRAKVLALLTELKHRGAPIDAYGMQGHFELGEDSIEPLRETFAALRGLGLKVVVSELDIDVVTRSRWWAENGKFRNELAQFDPYKDGLPADIAAKQAQQYADLFALFVENSDIIERVSFWNLHDGQSWLNGFPWQRVNHPLLFDRDRQPKPAFEAVLGSLSDELTVRHSSSDGLPVRRSSAAHTPIERTDDNSRLAHQQLVQKTQQGKIDVYFQGDSITRRWGATDYPQFLAHWKRSFHGWNAANFAWGGDTTHNMLWRMQNGELDGVTPKVFILQAGTNNLPWQGSAEDRHIDDVVSGIEALIAEFHRVAPEAKVILTAVFPRDQNPDLAPTITAINTRLESLADGERIRFVNINNQLTDAAGKLLPGISNDGLHLEQPGYELWATALRPVLEDILGPAAANDQAPPATGDPRAAR